mgnify:CR=1 FL=1
MAMTMHGTTMPHTPSFPTRDRTGSQWGLGTTASGTVERLVARYRTFRRYRRTVDELEACSPRVLRDLGIYRGDIRRLARETATENGSND